MNRHHKETAGGLVLRQITTGRGTFSLRIPCLEVPAGKIVCVVGPNGGGKTTLLLTVLGLLPHAGDCLVGGATYDGSNPVVKATIGFIPDDPSLLFEELTAQEQWQVTASVLAKYTTAARTDLLERAEALAARISFAPPSITAGQYSHGMRKKTQIVNALLGQPGLIVVDELRNGLDPIAIKQTEELMQSEAHRGAAILAATHDLWWAERFADYLYVLHEGAIVAEGTLRQVLQKGERHLEQAFLRIMGERRGVA